MKTSFLKARTNRAANSAFTLIELLVVIAIIAILAAILFPVFGRARENARRSSCQSNLKQIGLGIMQYTQDYDEYLPNQVIWAETTFPYVKSSQIYRCPSETYDSDVYPELRPTCSYAMNANLIYTFGTPKPRSLASLNSTVLTVMLAEVTGANSYTLQMGYAAPYGDGQGQPGNSSGSGAYVTGVMGGSTATSTNGRTITKVTDQPRHLGGANFLAADGHVKWMRGEKVSPGQDAAASSNAQGTGGSGAFAAGTDSMKDTNGAPFALTYSLN